MDIHQHFIFHKPYGTISQFVNPHKRKKKLLGEFFNFPEESLNEIPLKLLEMGCLPCGSLSNLRDTAKFGF